MDLSLHGFNNVKIIVSGGLDEAQVSELRDWVDGFGIGTSVAFPESVDFSADIVEKYINGKWVPMTKRGKWPGFKQVYRCGTEDRIVPWDTKMECEPLLKKYMEGGKLTGDLPSPSEIRSKVLSQIAQLTKTQSKNEK